MKLDPYRILNTKVNRLKANLRPEAVKLLGGKVGEKLHDTNTGSGVLDMSSKARQQKQK
jgi:hypothetical protein